MQNYGGDVMAKQHDIKELFPFSKNGYVAMDKGGDWHWWQIEPAIRPIHWGGYGNAINLRKAFNLAPYSGDWKDSLMKVEVAE